MFPLARIVGAAGAVTGFGLAFGLTIGIAADGGAVVAGRGAPAGVVVATGRAVPLVAPLGITVALVAPGVVPGAVRPPAPSVDGGAVVALSSAPDVVGSVLLVVVVVRALLAPATCT